jgi:hypothetical protein
VRAGLPREKPQFGHKWWPMCSAECERADREYNRARLAAKGQPDLRLPPRMPLSATPSPASPRTRRGAITREKKLYDGLVKEHFQSRGWQAFVVDRRGRFADALAVRGNSLAVIEVKSPNERKADLWYEARGEGDSRNLSPELGARHRDYLRTARKRACALVPGSSSLVRLYALTIAAQLYRYYFELEDLASQYESFTQPIKLSGVRFSKLPFLVVPAEYARELRTATEALAAHGFVVSPTFETTACLALASFSWWELARWSDSDQSGPGAPPGSP